MLAKSGRIEEYWVRFDDERDVNDSKFCNVVFDLVDSLKTALIVVLIVFSLLIRVVGVKGVSMQPTLNDGNVVCMSALSYNIKRGDIVVITKPWSKNIPIIKRVIGLEGDVIDIDFSQHKVYVNGTALDEPYIYEPTQLRFDVTFPLTVEEGKVFVLGDNRNNSTDSRSSAVGLIDEDYILGKMLFRLYPFGNTDNT